jgi:hypothetical protein
VKTNFYAVDPGKKYFAWVFVTTDRSINACGVEQRRGRDVFLHRTGPDAPALVIEHQRIIPGHAASPNDIVDLARSTGEIAGQFDDVTWAPLLNFTKPKRGEMSIPEARCRKYMTPAELALFTVHKKGELEHLWDAGYFALKYSGRCG